MTAWTAEECARAWGVRTPTFLGYVSRGQAPAPLPEPGEDGRRRWDAEAVRSFPRPGPGRSRSGATGAATALLDEMRETGAAVDALRARQRALLGAGRDQGLEISAMAAALGISRQTAYAWLRTR
jgi:hypothetical protein